MLFCAGARMEGTCTLVGCKYLVKNRHVVELWALTFSNCNRGGKARLWETQNWTNNEIKNPPGLWVKVSSECEEGHVSPYTHAHPLSLRASPLAGHQIVAVCITTWWVKKTSTCST
jgi:hypothetical protein